MLWVGSTAKVKQKSHSSARFSDNMQADAKCQLRKRLCFMTISATRTSYHEMARTVYQTPWRKLQIKENCLFLATDPFPILIPNR